VSDAEVDDDLVAAPYWKARGAHGSELMGGIFHDRQRRADGGATTPNAASLRSADSPMECETGIDPVADVAPAPHNDARIVSAECAAQVLSEMLPIEHITAVSFAQGFAEMQILPADVGAEKAATSLLHIAKRAASNSDVLARSRFIQTQRWSALNGPVLWAAASGEHSHAIIEWLARILACVSVHVPGLQEAHVHGQEAVFDAWEGLRTGLRACGISSRQGLIDWIAREGYGDVRNGGYLSGHVQARLISDAHEALLGADGHSHPPALGSVFVAATLQLAERADIEELAAEAAKHAEAPRKRARGAQISRIPDTRNEPPEDAYVLDWDGAAKGNPGLASAGAVLYAPASAGGHVVWAGSKFISEEETNNVAEYTAPIVGLTAAATIQGMRMLHCRGDSLLVVRQITGKWAVRSPRLMPLYNALLAAVRGLEHVSVSWEQRPRVHNWRADALANDAVDRWRRQDTAPMEWWGTDAMERVDNLPQPRRPIEPAVTPSAQGDIQQLPPHSTQGDAVRGNIPARGSEQTATPIRNGWECIDSISRAASVVSPFDQYAVGPDRFQDAWVLAIRDVLIELRDSDSDVR
jgi:ribonuclease HI